MVLRNTRGALGWGRRSRSSRKKRHLFRSARVVGGDGNLAGGDGPVAAEEFETAELRGPAGTRWRVACFYAQLRQRVALRVRDERDLREAVTVNHQERREAA